MWNASCAAWVLSVYMKLKCQFLFFNSWHYTALEMYYMAQISFGFACEINSGMTAINMLSFWQYLGRVAQHFIAILYKPIFYNNILFIPVHGTVASALACIHFSQLCIHLLTCNFHLSNFIQLRAPITYKKSQELHVWLKIAIIADVKMAA